MNIFSKVFKKKDQRFVLSEQEMARLIELYHKGYEGMNKEERETFLELSAKDFSNKFGKLIKQLARE